MTRKTKFIFTISWLLLSRSYDAYCTNQLTPDLSKENNPLVSILGMTWTPLLITLGVLTIYVFYISLFKPKNLLPSEKGYTFNEIIAFLYLGHKDNWTAIFYKLPKKIHRFNHYMGHTLTQCLTYAGVVSTIMWLLIRHNEFYKTIHSATLIYWILIIGCIVIVFNWSKTMYKLYVENTDQK